MADEITASASLKFTKSSRTGDLAFSGLTFDMSGDHYVRRTQEIGTSEELLGKGDIGTTGFLIIKNLDATNYVEFYVTSAGSGVVKLKAGEIAMFRASAALYGKANSAAVDVDYLWLED